MTRLRLVAAAGLVTVGLLTGCSGGGDDAPTTPAPSTSTTSPGATDTAPPVAPTAPGTLSPPAPPAPTSGLPIPIPSEPVD